MPQYSVYHKVDPKQEILDKVGSMNSLELWNNFVLVAIYVRPNVTAGGIIVTDKTTDEDIYQSKIGLVIAKGPSAFQPNDGWFEGGVTCEVGDWVIFRPSDGLHMKWGKDTNVRLFKDTVIIGKVSDPDTIY